MTYHVRLAFNMDAETPSDAVQDVVDLITEGGLRNLVYVVDNTEAGERVGYFNGWGETLDTEAVEARAAQARARNGAQIAPSVGDESYTEGDEDGTSGQDRDSYTDDQDRDSYTVSDDTELEQLAESLNQE